MRIAKLLLLEAGEEWPHSRAAVRWGQASLGWTHVHVAIVPVAIVPTLSVSTSCPPPAVLGTGLCTWQAGERATGRGWERGAEGPAGLERDSTDPEGRGRDALAPLARWTPVLRLPREMRMSSKCPHPGPALPPAAMCWPQPTCCPHAEARALQLLAQSGQALQFSRRWLCVPNPRQARSWQPGIKIS